MRCSGVWFHSFSLGKFPLQGQLWKHTGIIYDLWQLISWGLLFCQMTMNNFLGLKRAMSIVTNHTVLCGVASSLFFIIIIISLVVDRDNAQGCCSASWLCAPTFWFWLKLSGFMSLPLWLHKISLGPDGVLHHCFNFIQFVLTWSHTGAICDESRHRQTRICHRTPTF